MGLDEKSLNILSNPPTTKPLFPNLRYLDCGRADEVMPLLHLPFPSFISPDLRGLDTSKPQTWLQSFSTFSPNLTSLSIGPQTLCFRPVGKINFSHFCSWRNLQSLTCHRISLDVDALSLLSRMPSLTQLDFKLSAISLDFDVIISFSNLRDVTLRSKSLVLVQKLLTLIRLPIIADLAPMIGNTPSREEFSSLLACIQTSGIGHIIQGLQLYQWTPFLGLRDRGGPILGLEDLLPCMALSNLRHININVEWNKIGRAHV